MYVLKYLRCTHSQYLRFSYYKLQTQFENIMRTFFMAWYRMIK